MHKSVLRNRLGSVFQISGFQVLGTWIVLLAGGCWLVAQKILSMNEKSQYCLTCEHQEQQYKVAMVIPVMISLSLLVRVHASG
jgi:hypothetical protein